jgi:acetyltransferase-like isoleucine patch superfamily enzyme
MIKKLFHAVFLAIAIIPYVIYRFGSLSVAKSRAFTSMSQLLSLFPGFFGSYCRAAFYHLAMNKCPQSCEIGFLTTFSSPDISVGNNTIFSTGANIGRCHIGADCMIGTYAMITGGKNQHRFDSRDIPIRLQGGEFNPVTIGRDCWIGNGAIIMADLGEGCVIAAGSVVTKPIPSYSIAAGVPAKVIGERP